MKKVYFQPRCRVADLEPQSFLATSDLDVVEGEEGENEGLAREDFDWDW